MERDGKNNKRFVQMRRFKKKMLGWLDRKTVVKVYVQTHKVSVTISEIEGDILEVKKLSTNVTMIKYEQKV